METLIARFQAFYPQDLQQPLLFADGDDAMQIRLTRTPDVNGDNSGDIDLRDLSARFHICTYWPAEHAPGKSTWETHRFDLNDREGWDRMLNAFPQEPRVILPLGTTLQNHLRNMLRIWKDSPRDRETSHAIITIYDAAHSRPGPELTQEHTDAIERCLSLISVQMPMTREITREVDRILRNAGLETVPSDQSRYPQDDGGEGQKDPA